MLAATSRVKAQCQILNQREWKLGDSRRDHVPVIAWLWITKKRMIGKLQLEKNWKGWQPEEADDASDFFRHQQLDAEGEDGGCGLH